LHSDDDGDDSIASMVTTWSAQLIAYVWCSTQWRRVIVFVNCAWLSILSSRYWLSLAVVLPHVTEQMQYTWLASTDDVALGISSRQSFRKG